MSDSMGAMAYDERSDSGSYTGIPGYHEKKYSNETAKAIDEEVRQIIDQADSRATQIIEEHKTQVELITEMLIEFETLDTEDINKILNNEWDIEEKRARLRMQEDLHKKSYESAPATPPAEGAQRLTPPIAPAQPQA
jgi:cell division protease FtsH